MKPRRSRPEFAPIEPAAILVNEQTAARMLAISPRSLWTLRVSGAIPCVRINTSIRYRVSDIQSYVANLSADRPNSKRDLNTASLAGGVDTELAAFLDAYVEKRRADMKPWSIKMLQQCRMKLVTYFGAGRAIGSITAADAEDFQRAMKAGGSLAYAAKIVILSKGYFRRAVKARLLIYSPFADLKPGSQKNKARMHFVQVATIEKVIAAESDPQRAAIYALARYGGLRIPSELEHLKWSDVDFKRGRIMVRSVKTEHHVGRESRMVPLFPELLPTLMALYNDPSRHLVYVVPRFRNSKQNLRTHFLQKLRRLKIEPWPKLFQNLRSSRETELCEHYPSWAVCDWIGHTPEVAQDHYLNPRQEYFDAAVAGTKVLGTAGPMGPGVVPAPS